MSIVSKYNKGRLFFDYQIPKEVEYLSMADLFNENGKECVYPLRRVLINTKGLYGDSPILATDMGLINAPKHLLEPCQEMMKDNEFVNAVNDGKIGFTIYTYTVNNRVCYSVNWEMIV